MSTAPPKIKYFPRQQAAINTLNRLKTTRPHEPGPWRVVLYTGGKGAAIQCGVKFYRENGLIQ